MTMTIESSALIAALEASDARTAQRFPALMLKPPRPVVPMAERLQAAERLRERLSSVPFYAKKAALANQQGDEMAYWLSLQGSQMTAHRP